VDAAYAIIALDNDSAVRAPANEYITIIRHGKSQLARWQAFADGYQGYVPIGAKYMGDGQVRYGGSPSLHKRFPGDTDLALLNGADGDAELGPSMSFGLQQGRPTPKAPKGTVWVTLVSEPEGERIRPTEDQCAGLRKLLERESKYGSVQAAEMSSVTFGSSPLKELDNRRHDDGRNGNLFVKGQETDIDWWMDIRGGMYKYLQMDEIDQAAIPIQPLFYRAAKKYWVWIQNSIGAKMTYPGPYQDPGETEAVRLSMAGAKFADVFTERWMKANCPPKSSGKK